MFDFSFSEISLVLIVGLIFLGPKQLAATIKTVTRWLHSLRTLIHSLQREVTQELQLHELQDSIDKLTQLNLTQQSPDLIKELEELKLHALALQQAYQSQQPVALENGTSSTPSLESDVPPNQTD